MKEHLKPVISFYIMIVLLVITTILTPFEYYEGGSSENSYLAITGPYAQAMFLLLVCVVLLLGFSMGAMVGHENERQNKIDESNDEYYY